MLKTTAIKGYTDVEETNKSWLCVNMRSGRQQKNCSEASTAMVFFFTSMHEMPNRKLSDTSNYLITGMSVLSHVANVM
jgi:hypothetical protein